MGLHLGGGGGGEHSSLRGRAPFREGKTSPWGEGGIPVFPPPPSVSITVLPCIFFATLSSM